MQPIGIFVRSAAKTVTFVITVNRHFEFWRSCVHVSIKSSFSISFWMFNKSFLLLSGKARSSSKLFSCG